MRRSDWLQHCSSKRETWMSAPQHPYLFVEVFPQKQFSLVCNHLTQKPGYLNHFVNHCGKSDTQGFFMCQVWTMTMTNCKHQFQNIPLVFVDLFNLLLLDLDFKKTQILWIKYEILNICQHFFVQFGLGLRLTPNFLKDYRLISFFYAMQLLPQPPTTTQPTHYPTHTL